MKYLHLRLLFVPFFFTAVTNLVACQKSTQSPQNPVSTSTAQTPLPSDISKAPKINDSPVAEGTSHSGGGNGLGNKVLEHYAFSPQKHPAFQHLQSLQDRWIKDLKDTSQSFSLISPLLLKTWYLAPAEYKPISNQFLGITFFRKSTQQLAIQTLQGREIWIDNQFLQVDPKTLKTPDEITKNQAKMNDEEFSQLILHEWVMALYNLRFKKWSEFQREIQSAIPSISLNSGVSAENLQLVDDLLPSEPLRELTDKDYETIRLVTNYIFKNRKTISGQETLQLLLNNDFDPRFFNSKTFQKEDGNSKKQYLNLKSADMFAIFQKSVLSHRLPDKCHFYHFEKTIPCQTFLDADPKVFQYAPPLHGFHITFPDGSPLATVKSYFMDADYQLIQLQNISLKRDEDLYLGSLFTPIPSTTKVGDRILNTFIVIREIIHADQSADYKIEALMILPGVVTESVEETSNPDKAKNSVTANPSLQKKCKAISFNPQSFDEDIIMMGDKDFMLKHLRPALQATTIQIMCWPSK